MPLLSNGLSYKEELSELTQKLLIELFHTNKLFCGESVIMLTVSMLNVIIPNVLMLNIVLLNVAAPNRALTSVTFVGKV
jgi:hypothetical protein